MNYKYRIGLKEFVLTQQEHEQVVEKLNAREKGLVILRGGDMIFKLEQIGSVNKTDDRTEIKVLSTPPLLQETPVERKKRGEGWTRLKEWAMKQVWWKDLNNPFANK